MTEYVFIRNCFSFIFKHFKFFFWKFVEFNLYYRNINAKTFCILCITHENSFSRFRCEFSFSVFVEYKCFASKHFQVVARWSTSSPFFIRRTSSQGFCWTSIDEVICCVHCFCPQFLRTIRRIHRGPFLKLFIDIASCSNYNKVTDIIEINKLAMIRFRLSCENSGYSPTKVNIEISSKKHEMANYYCTTRINVQNKDLKFSRDRVCSEDWLSWEQIGCLNIGQKRNVVTELSIYAYTVATIGFAKLYDDKDLTDFELHAEGGSVSVHKVCLAARSDAFMSMLTGQWKEAKEDRIQLKDVTVKTLRQLKDYIYLGILPSHDNLRALLVLAARYFIDDLKAECVRLLATKAEPEQLVSLHNLACEYNIPELSIAISQLTPDEVIHKAYCLPKLATGGNDDDKDDKHNVK